MRHARWGCPAAPGFSCPPLLAPRRVSWCSFAPRRHDRHRTASQSLSSLIKPLALYLFAHPSGVAPVLVSLRRGRRLIGASRSRAAGGARRGGGPNKCNRLKIAEPSRSHGSTAGGANNGGQKHSRSCEKEKGRYEEGQCRYSQAGTSVSLALSSSKNIPINEAVSPTSHWIGAALVDTLSRTRRSRPLPLAWSGIPQLCVCTPRLRIGSA